MIYKILSAFFYFIPLFLFFFIYTEKNEFIAVASEIGFYQYHILIFLITVTVFFGLRFLFNRLFKYKFFENDENVNKATFVSLSFGLLFSISSLFVVIIGTIVTDYGKWSSGIDKLDIVDKFEKKMDRYDRSVIKEMKEISDKSKSKRVQDFTNSYLYRFQKLEACRDSLASSEN